jgi:hypothetical protein
VLLTIGTDEGCAPVIGPTDAVCPEDGPADTAMELAGPPDMGELATGVEMGADEIGWPPEDGSPEGIDEMLFGPGNPVDELTPGGREETPDEGGFVIGIKSLKLLSGTSNVTASVTFDINILPCSVIRNVAVVRLTMRLRVRLVTAGEELVLTTPGGTVAGLVAAPVLGVGVADVRGGLLRLGMPDDAGRAPVSVPGDEASDVCGALVPPGPVEYSPPLNPELVPMIGPPGLEGR